MLHLPKDTMSVKYEDMFVCRDCLIRQRYKVVVTVVVDLNR